MGRNCPECGRASGHAIDCRYLFLPQDPAGMLDPEEIADLMIVAARARLDRGDLAPMQWIAGDVPATVVIPWREAVEIE
jgi:hypothetical protein